MRRIGGYIGILIGEFSKGAAWGAGVAVAIMVLLHAVNLNNP